MRLIVRHQQGYRVKTMCYRLRIQLPSATFSISGHLSMVRSCSGKQSHLATFPSLMPNHLSQQIRHHQVGLQLQQVTYLMTASGPLTTIYTAYCSSIDPVGLKLKKVLAVKIQGPL
ncbi:hypothetical protein Tco_0063849 [Tanacetum coccineum]